MGGAVMVALPWFVTPYHTKTLARLVALARPMKRRSRK
jgi:hypothetical protein